MVGTFNGNPLAMAACRAMLCEVATPEAYRRLAALRERAVEGIQREISRTGPGLPQLPRPRRCGQPCPLAVPAQRGRLPAAMGQGRAMADLGSARYGRY